MLCSLGCGRDAIKIGKSGRAWCELSPNKCPAKRERDSSKKKGINPWDGKEHPRGAAGKNPWNKGLTKDSSDLVKSSSEKCSQSMKGKNKGKTASEETRQKMSESKRRLYLAGWDPICGRCKKISYESKAGPVKLDGSWELLVAKYLDYLNLKWLRNYKRFEYINLNEKNATYRPDFWVEEWTSYLEVKGYETDLDRCKWRQFPEPLLVWRKDKIEEIKKILGESLPRVQIPPLLP